MNPLIKENSCRKSYNNVELCSNKQEKVSSADAKTNVKQQKTKQKAMRATES